jgi:hypothetical protein
MGVSAVDEWDLNQIDLGQVNSSESSFNGSMNNVVDSAQSEDEVSDEIARYLQELLDRNTQQLSSSESDTSGARHRLSHCAATEPSQLHGCKRVL